MDTRTWYPSTITWLYLTTFSRQFYIWKSIVILQLAWLLKRNGILVKQGQHAHIVNKRTWDQILLGLLLQKCIISMIDIYGCVRPQLLVTRCRSEMVHWSYIITQHNHLLSWSCLWEWSDIASTGVSTSAKKSHSIFRFP